MVVRRADALALAVDLGGTKVEAALVTAAGEVVRGSALRAPTGPTSTPGSLEAALARSIGGALSALPPGCELVGVGVGTAGPVDRGLGMIRPVNLAGIRDFPLQDVVRRIVPQHPVTMRLDGTCIALAEHWVGAIRGSDDSMAIVVSTGIGAGIISGGRLLAGRSGNAGHLGQTIARRRGSGVGATLEAIASGPSTVAWARRRGWIGSTGEDLADAVSSAEPVAIAAVRRSAKAVGRAIAGAATLLDLEVVSIGGGFVGVSPDYLDLVRESVRAAAVLGFARAVRVVPAGLGPDGPLIGAGALVLRPAVLG